MCKVDTGSYSYRYPYAISNIDAGNSNLNE